MDYALAIGFKYLRSKKTKTVRVITFIAVAGVALGVAALLAVMSITSGFQEEFRNKVLGVNAHVLVMRYGDFEEYRDVVARAQDMPEVAGAGPFLIKEMMLANGDRIGGVLVKGIDPELMPTVLDLPDQMIEGTLDGIRVPGAAPPRRSEDADDRELGEGEDLDAYLDRITAMVEGHAPVAPSPDAPSPEAPAPEGELPIIPLPAVHVPTPEEAAAALLALDDEGATGEDDLFHEDREDVVPTEDLPGLVVGVTLAHNLDIHVGDRVRVISPLAGLSTSTFSSSRASTPVSHEFRVIGIFAAGFEEYDTHLVYADLYQVESFFDSGDSVDGVEIRLREIDDAAMISRRLERVLGGGPYHTMDWEELNHNLFTALEIQKVMLSLVIATIIFVAAFNVIATLIMIVLEKKREIAILKAMGARDSHVLAMFMVQGTVIGLFGTLIGLVLGGGVCLVLEARPITLDAHVYLIDHLPVQTSMWEFLWTALIALCICVLATLVPSWWAARLLPAEGVRHE